MTQPWQPPDLDEIRPDRFIINNDKVRPVLRGEGVTVGKFFELVTWRREGLIGRIRMRGFNVRTLEDRVTTLRGVKSVDPPGAEGVRVLHHPKERIAHFDSARLHWCDLPTIDHGGKPAVRLPVNVAIRRRKGRGHADYYITATVGHGEINFVPTKEVAALIHAYSQIAQEHTPVVRYTLADEIYTIPRQQALLPPQHQEVLEMLAVDKAEPWSIPAPVFDLAAGVFAKLGIDLQPQQ
ncbi:MAG TPA: hypothetical protein VGD69_22110 [Herpetosiphonaceae bacterium]